MSKRSMINDATKLEIAKEFGFADKIKQGNSLYFGEVSARENGLLVKGLIERAEKNLMGK